MIKINIVILIAQLYSVYEFKRWNPYHP